MLVLLVDAENINRNELNFLTLREEVSLVSTCRGNRCVNNMRSYGSMYRGEPLPREFRKGLQEGSSLT